MNNLAVDRTFKLWAYTVSHSTLILRSPMKFEDQAGFKEELSFNIDIEFLSVEYIDLPLCLVGVEIERLIENLPSKFENYKLDVLGLSVFQIKSCDNLYYVIASGYIVGKNKWVAEDRISNMFLQYDEILSKC